MEDFKCPSCGTSIDIKEVAAEEVAVKLRQQMIEYNAKKEKEFLEKERVIKAELEAKTAEIANKEQVFNQKTLAMQSEIDKKVAEKAALNAAEQEKTITAKLQQDYEVQLKSATAAAEEANAKLKEARTAQIENEKLKRDLASQKDEIELIMQQRFSQQLNDELKKTKQALATENELKIKESESVIAQLKEQMKIMQQKAEQGSMQLQGEVQEVILEAFLRNEFRYDDVKEVRKGANGADALQTVRNQNGQSCGTILFESKRTKSFSKDWIQKLKTDGIQAKADVCVLVSVVLPDGVEGIGQIDGVWICDFNNVRPLVTLLRQQIIAVSTAMNTQANKGDKMQMLYDYLTGLEFKNQVGAVMQGFIAIREGYTKERMQMEKIWKEREKQLEKVLLNTTHFVGSIEGIANVNLDTENAIEGTDNGLLIE